ncbi:MAG: dipeptidase [Bacteroidota bacterium]
MISTQQRSYIQVHGDRFLEELKEFLRIPSVTTAPQHAEDVRRAAQFVREKLLAAGLDRAELLGTAGNPLVYAEKIIDSSLPTVLLYGHYDVQPADPYELWDHPPFEPTIKRGRIYARGASDDKGQVYLHIKALETILSTGALPCNVKVLIEGEEEVGSGNLALFLKDEKNQALLQTDAIIVSDSAFLSPEQPAIIMSLRGITAFDITLTGPSRDLHSGVYGGAVANPLNVLCKMIAALHDQDGRISIPGFYDQVLEPDDALKATLAQMPFDLDHYQQGIETEAITGEVGYSTVERTGIRPALDVNGIWGGYTGHGPKSIIPAEAHAKLSIRLAPCQEVAQVTAQFKSYLTSLTPHGMQLSMQVHQGDNAVVFDSQAPAVAAASKAFETIWHKRPIFTREGASIPILAAFQQTLRCNNIAMMGFGLESDAIHAPNEHFVLSHFYKGIETVVTFYQEFAKLHNAK